MRHGATFTVLTMLAGSAHGQLRPKRVGTNALGEQQVEFTDVPSNAGGGADADPMAAMRAAMQAGGGGGLEGMDMAALMKGMANNPMMKQLAESLGEANPEVAELLNNPEAMAAQMQQMQQMMASPEGQETMQNMMKEMQSVMTCASPRSPARRTLPFALCESHTHKTTPSNPHLMFMSIVAQHTRICARCSLPHALARATRGPQRPGEAQAGHRAVCEQPGL